MLWSSVDLLVNKFNFFPRTNTYHLYTLIYLSFLVEECAKLVTSSLSQLEEELDEERKQQQSRVKDYNRLEQRYENLKVREGNDLQSYGFIKPQLQN